jgi:hypothetical protein
MVGAREDSVAGRIAARHDRAMSKARIGSFEDLLEITVPALQPIARRLKALVLEVDPDAVEVVRLGDRAATYGLGPKKMSEGYVYILPYDEWVNLGFYKGADLPDPDVLLEGTGARMRHVKVRSVAEVEQAALRILVTEALSERRRALGR